MAILFIPVELLRLHSRGAFEILPTLLLGRTPYLKLVEELVLNFTTKSQGSYVVQYCLISLEIEKPSSL